MKLSRPQLGLVLLIAIIAAIFGIYKYFFAPKPYLRLLSSPKADTCFTNKPITITWMSGYKGKISVSFVSDTNKNAVLREIAQVENNPNKETSFEWKASNLKNLENQKGYIRIVGASTVFSESSFVIVTPIIVAPKLPEKSSGIAVFPEFSSDGKTITLRVEDSLTGNPLRGTVFRKNGHLRLGKTDVALNNILINIAPDRQDCTGKDISASDQVCTKTVFTYTFSTEEIEIVVPTYKTWNSKPVQTVYSNDQSGLNCKCDTAQIKNIMLRATRVFRLKENIQPVPEKMERIKLEKVENFRVSPTLMEKLERINEFKKIEKENN